MDKKKILDDNGDVLVLRQATSGGFTERKRTEVTCQKAGTLSGGEQQMLAIARALIARPKLLLLDEPSIGLAPLVITELTRVIKDINKNGITVVLLEQNAGMVSLRLQIRNTF